MYNVGKIESKSDSYKILYAFILMKIKKHYERNKKKTQI